MHPNVLASHVLAVQFACYDWPQQLYNTGKPLSPVLQFFLCGDQVLFGIAGNPVIVAPDFSLNESPESAPGVMLREGLPDDHQLIDTTLRFRRNLKAIARWPSRLDNKATTTHFEPAKLIIAEPREIAGHFDDAHARDCCKNTSKPSPTDERRNLNGPDSAWLWAVVMHLHFRY
jgi:hypothetical protein